jgi:dihydroneopterin aldolase/2-amino-4-hydroxy-6-hydroxymethyldihydropteridine diphosphokinase
MDNKMDKIRIKNLEVFAYHGVFEEEKVKGQTFIVDLTLHLDTRKPGQTDLLEDALDYGEVCYFVNDYMRDRAFDLLEALAENLAKDLLLKFSKAKEVELEIKKPSAPINLPFEYVSILINRRWHSVYIGLGSNMGDKKKYLEEAIISINNKEGCKVNRASSFIETKPYGNIKQDDYLNGCILIETLHSPRELLAILNEIERLAGRVRGEKWQKRTLDLDILFYDELIYNSQNLSIPHYDLHNRKFVLDSLYEIAPQYCHPIKNKTVEEMWKEVSQKQ